jgi:hypothetical protein
MDRKALELSSNVGALPLHNFQQCQKSNWSGWHVDFEKYIKECYGEQALIDMDLR